MSVRRGTEAPAGNNAPPGLPSPGQIPLDQLSQIQKRLQALVQSTGQLQAEIAVVPNFDWQTILTRYGSLVSQVYSLSSALTSPTSAFVPAQQETLNKHLEDEAKNRNYFMQEEPDEDEKVIASLPRVKYTDEKNLLPRLAATPIHALQGDKAARLGEALRTKLDPDVEATLQHETDEQEEEQEPTAALSKALGAVSQHDNVSMRALRTWYHVRWRPDDLGQTYDFRMRLGDDDDGLLDEDEQQQQQQGGAEEQQATEVGAANAEILPDAQEEQYEDDEEVDEEMEDIV